MPGNQQTSFKERLTGAFIGLGVCIVSMPIAVVATIILLPFWRWLEKTLAVESVGHSGPSEWCYLFIYMIVVFLAGLIWSRIRKRQVSR